MDTRLRGHDEKRGGHDAGGVALLRLITWLSPSFPVGGYSYSGGLEMAVESGLVTGTAGLRGWIEAQLAWGGLRADAAVLALAFRAAQAGDHAALLEIAAQAAARRAGAEAKRESLDQGAAFLRTVVAAWALPGLAADATRLSEAGIAPAYPIAVALAGAHGGLDGADLALAWLQAACAALVGAGMKLMAVGQTDGQRLLAGLEPLLIDAARRAQAATLDSIGSATPVADWAGLAHETQYSRLFRS